MSKSAPKVQHYQIAMTIYVHDPRNVWKVVTKCPIINRQKNNFALQLLVRMVY